MYLWQSVPRPKGPIVLDDIPELVTRSLQGEQAAMRALVDHFGGQVFCLCYRMLGNRHDAEDVTQESLCRALRSLGNWDAGCDFAPWLLAIAGNRCRTWLATRSRRPPTTLLADHLAVERPLEAVADGLNEEIQLALAGMRAEYRQAFLLFHQDEMSYEEIASALDRPLGTVKTWVHRARRELAQFLIARGALEDNFHVVRRI